MFGCGDVSFLAAGLPFDLACKLSLPLYPLRNWRWQLLFARLVFVVELPLFILTELEAKTGSQGLPVLMLARQTYCVSSRQELRRPVGLCAW